MEFFHFARSQRYRSRLPLRQLQFKVTVYRALVVEEDRAELLVEATVGWDDKVLSPPEILSLYKDAAHLSQREAAKAIPYSDKPCDPGDATALEPDGAPPACSPGAVPEPITRPLLSLLPDTLSLPAPSDIVAQLRRLKFFLFTRPSLEDFINRAEEDVPVDPSPGPSLLAPIILRQHRRDHQPNRRMFFMWAAGELQVCGQPAGAESTAPVEGVGCGGADEEAQADALRKKGPATDAASSAHPTATAAADVKSSIDMDDVTWSGDERVLCTLTAEQDERFFTAKPSLGELHTLLVDAAYIYTFRVTVSHADASAGWLGQWAGNGARQDVLADGRLSPSSIAPLEVLLSNVRDVARYVEEQCEALGVSKGALSRRLLRQAAMMAPPDRGGTDAGASASDPSSSGGARRRHRRGALGAVMPLSPAADRAGAACSAKIAASSSRSPHATPHGVALLPRVGAMRSTATLPHGLCQYYVFGTVDRCVGIAEPTLFVRCQLVEDEAAAASMYESLPSSSSPSSCAVCTFSSQLAHAGTFVEGEFLLDIDHVFNVPFEYSFVGAALPCSPLRLVATAFAEGTAAEGLQAPVAYACVSLPTASPGRHALKAPMWAPHKTGAEFLCSTLIGGAPGLVDARQAGPAPAYRTGLNVKEGLYADSVGVLHITVSVLHHIHLHTSN
ncbi:hypothetical protein LSCM1_06166 [Leishmania martiniquensis]|uniref:Meckel syndrome type 1 protein n=1 Tax=Leishmania martiniquensis TaxID=1580590 RepID=A0A836KMQ2_9TRYP|nr:hypothetical protein LSCM1_06166 [Leishmania martiniquensis]